MTARLLASLHGCLSSSGFHCLFVSFKCLAPSYLPKLLWVHTPAGADKLLLDIPNMLALNQRGFGLLYQYFTAFLHFNSTLVNSVSPWHLKNKQVGLCKYYPYAIAGTFNSLSIKLFFEASQETLNSTACPIERPGNLNPVWARTPVPRLPGDSEREEPEGRARGGEREGKQEVGREKGTKEGVVTCLQRIPWSGRTQSLSVCVPANVCCRPSSLYTKTYF